MTELVRRWILPNVRSSWGCRWEFLSGAGVREPKRHLAVQNARYWWEGKWQKRTECELPILSVGWVCPMISDSRCGGARLSWALAEFASRSSQYAAPAVTAPLLVYPGSRPVAWCSSRLSFVRLVSSLPCPPSGARLPSSSDSSRSDRAASPLSFWKNGSSTMEATESRQFAAGGRNDVPETGLELSVVADSAGDSSTLESWSKIVSDCRARDDDVRDPKLSASRARASSAISDARRSWLTGPESQVCRAPDHRRVGAVGVGFRRSNLGAQR